MSLRSQYKLDAEKVDNGIEIQREPNADGSIPTFRLAFMGRMNKAYAKAMDAATKPHRAAINAGKMSSELAEQIFLDVFIRTVLKGWDNVLASDVFDTEEAAGFAPYCKENALKLFESMPILYDELQEEAKNVANYRQELMEESAKN